MPTQSEIRDEITQTLLRHLENGGLRRVSRKERGGRCAAAQNQRAAEASSAAAGRDSADARRARAGMPGNVRSPSARWAEKRSRRVTVRCHAGLCDAPAEAWSHDPPRRSEFASPVFAAVLGMGPGCLAPPPPGVADRPLRGQEKARDYASRRPMWDSTARFASASPQPCSSMYALTAWIFRSGSAASDRQSEGGEGLSPSTGWRVAPACRSTPRDRVTFRPPSQEESAEAPIISSTATAIPTIINESTDSRAARHIGTLPFSTNSSPYRDSASSERGPLGGPPLGHGPPHEPHPPEQFDRQPRHARDTRIPAATRIPVATINVST